MLILTSTDDLRETIGERRDGRGSITITRAGKTGRQAQEASRLNSDPMKDGRGKHEADRERKGKGQMQLLTMRLGKTEATDSRTKRRGGRIQSIKHQSRRKGRSSVGRKASQCQCRGRCSSSRARIHVDQHHVGRGRVDWTSRRWCGGIMREAHLCLGMGWRRGRRRGSSSGSTS